MRPAPGKPPSRAIRGLTWLLVALVFSGTATARAAAEVVDDLGRGVATQPAARRIVTLAPHATELALAAGAGDRLVAVAAGSPADARIADVPRLGVWGGLDRERLLTLRPDLVIGWHSGNRPADLDWIEHAGIRLYRTEPRSLDDVADAIRALGALSGTQRTAAAAAAAFKRRTATRCADLTPVPVYVEVWTRPAMSVGGRHWINAVLRAAALGNVLETVPLGVFAVADETVLAHRALPRVSLQRRHDGGAADRLAALLARPGPALTDAVEALCAFRLQLDDAALLP